MSAYRVRSSRAERGPLTGLPGSRDAVSEYLERQMARASAGTVDFIGVILADVDYFKKVNDAHGHLAGDAVLRKSQLFSIPIYEPFDAAGSLWRGRVPGSCSLIVMPRWPERWRKRIQFCAFRADKFSQVLRNKVFPLSPVVSGYCHHPMTRRGALRFTACFRRLRSICGQEFQEEIGPFLPDVPEERAMRAEQINYLKNVWVCQLGGSVVSRSFLIVTRYGPRQCR